MYIWVHCTNDHKWSKQRVPFSEGHEGIKEVNFRPTSENLKIKGSVPEEKNAWDSLALEVKLLKF